MTITKYHLKETRPCRGSINSLLTSLWAGLGTLYLSRSLIPPPHAPPTPPPLCTDSQGEIEILPLACPLLGQGPTLCSVSRHSPLLPGEQQVLAPQEEESSRLSDGQLVSNYLDLDWIKTCFRHQWGTPLGVALSREDNRDVKPILNVDTPIPGAGAPN